MSDRRDEILKMEYLEYYRHSYDSYERTVEVVDMALSVKEETDAIKNAMDEYFTERALELLEYMLKNCVAVTLDENNEKRFLYKTGVITKEQLFENFL